MKTVTVTRVVRLLPPANLITEIEIPPWDCKTNGDVWRRAQKLEDMLWAARIDRGALRIWCERQGGTHDSNDATAMGE